MSQTPNQFKEMLLHLKHYKMLLEFTAVKMITAKAYEMPHLTEAYKRYRKYIWFQLQDTINRNVKPLPKLIGDINPN